MFTYQYTSNGEKQTFRHAHFAYIRSFILSRNDDDPIEVIDGDGEVVLTRSQLLELKAERKEAAGA